MNIIDVWINCPSKQVAGDIAQALLHDRLIACANVFPPIDSQYFWRGGVETASEVPLLVKTRKGLFHKLAERVGDLHPYETPGIMAVDIADANHDYLEWVYQETDASGAG